ncbi:TonB-dependent receptor [Ulvibacterium sp.]|uniref:SusC/RagA family TonB-linked outer membrane protein n=1 Tax=Ulvibacterium sp. TaxID=2665914 RepID=UPI0026264661|nr:TonB-dependent receptor [Ulvibacterium sp.]
MTQKHKKHVLWPQARNHDFLKLGLLSLLLVLGLQTALAGGLANLDDPKTTVFQSSVTGTVTDDTGAPLPGASIVEKGTTNGTQTDFDGNYTINVDSGATLVVSYIGYATQEIAVNGQSTVDVTLQEDASQLDEVVLVGYGTQSRVAVTNAISSVNSEDLVETPAIGVEQALQGRAAGVQVTNRGTPGAAPLVTIRGLGTFGNNQPLFIVDGVPTGNLNNIPAEAIESVDILKDASSAAIYGSRASNGVVLIKTKGGKKGRTSFRASSYAGLSSIPKTLDVLNAEQYRQYASEAYDADPVEPGNQIYPGLQPGNFDPAVSTDYQDEITRTGLWQNYDIEASGGSENATYSVRLGYLNQEGALIESRFDRYSVGLNTTIDLSDKITMGQTLNLGLSRTFGGDGGTILGNATRFDPTRPVFDEETNFYSEITTSFNGQDIENPVRLRENGEFLTTQTSIVGSIFGSYEIIPGLTYRLTIGLDHAFTNQDNFEPSIPTGSRTRLFSETRDNRRRNLSTVITNTLTYNKTFNEKHNLDVLAGYERNRTVFDRIDAFTINPLTDNVQNLNPNEVENLTSSENENNLHSVFGRVGYDFDRTFFLSGTLRADGSSRFAPGNQWGYFPSVSGAVNLANLPFLQDSEDLSTLKLRASWGITGNNNIGNYQFQTGLLTDFNYVIDGTLVSGTRPARIPNEQLQWEELTSLNIGADLAFFNNALTVSAEYFKNESDGLLVDVPLPASLGATTANQTRNVGGTELTGLEFTVGYKDFEGDFTWGANLNMFATLNQEVTSLGSVDAIFSGNWFQQFHTRLFVGEAPFHFFGLRTDGIFQNQAEVDAHATQNNAEPGNIRYVDTNNDGAINADDRVVIGNPNPDFQLGADFNFKYKNLDFSVFLVGEYGRDIYNGFRLTLEQQARLFNMSTDILDRWSPTNPSQTIPKATPGFTGNEQVSDRFIEDGSFTRVRSMTLGYTIPSRVLTNFANGSISRLRFYVSGQNLITFTDYSGYDPEIVPVLDGGTDINTIGLDQGRFPQARTVLAGLQIEF